MASSLIRNKGKIFDYSWLWLSFANYDNILLDKHAHDIEHIIKNDHELDCDQSHDHNYDHDHVNDYDNCHSMRERS